MSANQSWVVDYGTRTVTIRTTFAKTFVDNTYGTGAIGWPKRSHTFDNLLGSDQLTLGLYDSTGVQKMNFDLDYFTSVY